MHPLEPQRNSDSFDPDRSNMAREPITGQELMAQRYATTRMESAARSLGLTTPAEIAAFARGSTWCMSEVHKHFTLTPKGPPLDEETIRAYMRGEYR